MVMPSKTILQCNIGRSWDAWHLLTKQAEELNADLCVISEPCGTADSSQGYRSLNGLAAIWKRPASPGVCRLVKRARDIVVVDWEGMFIASCYISPNASHTSLFEFLDDLSAIAGQFNEKLIICGDFNAKSAFWGCPRTDGKGRLIEEWAAEYDMRLVNTGNTPTCVRPQGVSIIDLTWCSADILPHISSWTVRSDIESLSDHNYIATVLGGSQRGPISHASSCRYRWNWKSCDVDSFRAVIEWESSQWVASPRDSIDARVEKITHTLRRACDAAMTRVRPSHGRRRVY